MSGEVHGFEIPAEMLIADGESLAKVPRVAAIIPPVTYEQLTSLPSYLQKKVGRNKQYSLHNPPDPALVARLTAEHLFVTESEVSLNSDQWRVLAWIAQKGIVWMKSVPKWGVDGDEFLLHCRKRLKLEPSVIGHVILPPKSPLGESLQKPMTAEENLTQIDVSSDPESVKTEIEQAKHDWTLELSQEESRAILEQFKDRLPRDFSLNDAMVALHVTSSKAQRKEENSDTVVDHDFGLIPSKEHRSTQWATKLLQEKVRTSQEANAALRLFTGIPVGDREAAKTFVKTLKALAKFLGCSLSVRGSKCTVFVTTEKTGEPRFDFRGIGDSDFSTTAINLPLIRMTKK